MIGVLIKERGRFRHRNMETAHEEEGHMTMEAEIGVMPLQKKEPQG